MNRIDFTLGFGGLIGTSAYSLGTGAHTILSSLPAPPQPSHNVPTIPENILDDLVIRFTMNIPEEERDPTRVCFQIELAHWFLVDRYCSEGADPKMAAMGHIRFQDFAALMFQRTPYLKQHFKNFDSIITTFKEYKQKVPTYGAILMNQELTHVVLVQSFSGHWGFPKGKVNKDEDPTICAVREVREEVGYDISSKLIANHFIESESNDRKSRLYIIRGVDTNFPFHPETQYEIKNIAWFGVEELPENKRDPNVVSTRGYTNSNFFPVYSYVKRLKRWVADKLQGKNAIQCFRSYPNNNFTGHFPYSYDNETNAHGSVGQDSTKGLIASHREYNMKPIGTPSDPTRNPQEKKANKIILPKTQYCDVFNNFLMTPPKNEMNSNSNRSLCNSGSSNNPVTYIQKPRNPKRRLFVDEVETAEKNQHQQHLTMLFSQAQMQVSKQRQKKNSSYDKLCSPSWLNFSFDREPIIRALKGD